MQRPVEPRMRFRLTAAWFWGILIVASLAGGSWLARAWLNQALWTRPSLVPVLFVGLVVAWSLLALSLWVESAALHTAWRQRTAQVAGLSALEREAGWRRLLRRFPDPLERLSRPLLQTAWGRRLADEWLDAGLGKKPSRYLVLLLLAALGGGLLGRGSVGRCSAWRWGWPRRSFRGNGWHAGPRRDGAPSASNCLTRSTSWRAAWQPGCRFNKRSNTPPPRRRLPSRRP